MPYKQIILNTAVIINTAIFFSLSILHFYWGFGGRLWYNDVLPTNSTGSQQLSPSITATLIIGFGLLFFALITITNHRLFIRYNQTFFRYGTVAIAIIFLIRAIGDFKFIGFFKTIKFTRFGINDTQIFSPLCLFISLLSLIIFVLSRDKSELIK
jgi:hypothetical protein